MAVRRENKVVVVEVSPYCNNNMRLHSIDAYKKRNPKGRGAEMC